MFDTYVKPLCLDLTCLTYKCSTSTHPMVNRHKTKHQRPQYSQNSMSSNQNNNETDKTQEKNQQDVNLVASNPEQRQAVLQAALKVIAELTGDSTVVGKGSGGVEETKKRVEKGFGEED